MRYGFLITEHVSAVTVNRYLLFLFDTHYGSDSMCAMNGIEVYGVSAAQELEQALAMHEEEFIQAAEGPAGETGPPAGAAAAPVEAPAAAQTAQLPVANTHAGGWPRAQAQALEAAFNTCSDLNAH